MPNFAVIDGINVVNKIVADSKAIAEEVTGKTCVEFTESDIVEQGGIYENGKFIGRKPYPSWILENDIWVAPVPYPEEGKAYYWDEPTLKWIKVNP